MYVKEDVILPQNTTFYELIVSRSARGPGAGQDGASQHSTRDCPCMIASGLLLPTGKRTHTHPPTPCTTTIPPHTHSRQQVNKAMGKSGPLFQFDLHEHAAASFDPRMKSQDSHAGKVVDRHWYNKVGARWRWRCCDCRWHDAG